MLNLLFLDYGYVQNETGEKEKEEEKKKEAAKPAASKPSLFASLADFKPGPNLFSSNTGIFYDKYNEIK